MRGKRGSGHVLSIAVSLLLFSNVHAKKEI